MKTKYMLFTLLVLCISLFSSRTSFAGEWVLDHYIYESASKVAFKEKLGTGPLQTLYSADASIRESQEIRDVPGVGSNSTTGISGYSASVQLPIVSTRLSVTPVYVWNSPGEKPAEEFFVRERGQCTAILVHHCFPNGENVYTLQNPYSGTGFTITSYSNGFSDDMTAGVNPNTDDLGYFERVAGDWHVNKISTKGKTEVAGPTRSLFINIRHDTAVALSGPQQGESVDSITGNAYVYYEAEVCKFALGVDTDIVQDNSAGPRDRSFIAYAHKNWTNRIDPDPAEPSEFYWDGAANYTPMISDNLQSTLGVLTYKWQLKDHDSNLPGSDPEEYSGNVVPTLRNTYPETPEVSAEKIETDTPTKSLHHNVQDFSLFRTQPVYNDPTSVKWPRKTLTRVIVSGSNAAKGNLTAKAQIEWNDAPYTKYRVRLVTKYINLETGAVAYAPASTENAGPESEDADPADVYAQEVLSAKKEFFDAVVTYVGGPLELGETAYTTAFDLIIPDKYDLAFTVIDNVPGEVLHKVFKVGEATAKFVEIAAKISEKLGGKSEKVLKAGRDLLDVADDVPVVAETRMEFIRLERGGKLVARDERESADLGVIATKKCWMGKFCFVKGTPVLMANGNLKPIELVKVGDIVLSKNESNGEVAPRRVMRTTQRQAPGTIRLTFASGETVETTVEHPFYEEHKGFTPAGLLAVGNSIVTHAGPAVSIAHIKHRTYAYGT